ncbi:plasmid IncI1-type surface exclusion protein ExcA [Pantoea ananatis]|uniref:plasmid IncI1-type surface exclusion protein ExcA n=1 Tax=Pantoea ananas TaxID=553 RepID=UPI0007DAB77A|nr:plasmid IncI1-type surface exclusion protein ExcA [Pantoea ananatis]
MSKVNRKGYYLSLPFLIWLGIRSVYYMVLLPCAVFLAAITLFIFMRPFKHNLYTSDYVLLTMLWIFILLPLAYRYISIKLRKRNLQKMSLFLKSDKRFNPNKTHEVFNAVYGKYFGVDINRGTILFIDIHRKRIIDVVGITMDTWTNIELQGSVIRVYTSDPELPMLSITAPLVVVSGLYNTLGAMRHKSYSEPYPDEPWQCHVARQSRFIEFEHKVTVPQAAI